MFHPGKSYEYRPVDPVLPNRQYLHLDGDTLGNIVRQMNGDTQHPDPFIATQIYYESMINPPRPFGL